MPSKAKERLMQDNTLYTVSKNTENNIIYIRVLGFINLGELQQMWKEAIPMMQDKRQKILYDATYGKALSAEARQWVIEVLGVTLTEKKIKMARIVSYDIFNNLIAKQIKEQLGNKNPKARENIEVFENEAKAVEWLLVGG